MKRVFLSACLIFGMSLSTFAQELPQPSPSATVMQRVGLTDVTINFSRPGVKDRVIFGELVPYDQLWRTGANKATAVTFSTDVMIDGKTLPAGTYSLFTIPGKDNWTLIFNKETELWGTNGYDEAKDALRVDAKPMTSANKVQNMMIEVDNVSSEGAHLIFAWDNVRVAVPFTVNTAAVAESNIQKAIAEDGENARVYRNAANYYFNNGMNDKALAMMEKSIKIDDSNWYSNWLYAEILHSVGMDKDAKKAAKNAIKVGEKASEESGNPFPYKSMIETEMAKW
ncbi:MAG: DUF2911 domain-containing protein [Bacteroidota bacterium]|nr:DUF2911 domain-containing protein [Bacteroidota bacterium]MDX5404960.1 DUF2911 domain-containing protein [Bacteroidota bacterium]MDX5427688.1 DUF2911 domain-containing protein [Bacteroidota bacterium]MDX5449121.1 DUF2911 domain-containing protein [Bacteroidota bacterium]MDX5505585.1 DUF2911 domain-containing protein [Bacteroidota bacterium]